MLYYALSKGDNPKDKSKRKIVRHELLIALNGIRIAILQVLVTL